MVSAKKLLWAVPVLAGALFAALNLANEPGPGELQIELQESRLVANGLSQAVLRIKSTRTTPPGAVSIRILQGSGYVEPISRENDVVVGRVRTSVQPGPVELEVTAPNHAARRVRFETNLDTADQFADGTPDFLRLGPSDEEAFRKWFTFLAESQYYRRADQLPAEIDDCAALLRFAFRETLRLHDGEWLSNQNFSVAPAFPSVRKYVYPGTPLGAGLFRIRGGRFQQTDLRDGTFAQFADAQTLQRHNTHLVSRDIDAALPGDLLFYRQTGQALPSHAMIVLGPSYFEPGGATSVIYHTGPMDDSIGEIRRPTVDELLRHPEAKWRPVESNANFLGVYRWNILR